MHASFHACMHAPSSCMKFHALRTCMYTLHACMHPLHACMKHACKSANLYACIMHAVHASLMHDSCMHCMHDACMQCMHAQFRREKKNGLALNITQECTQTVFPDLGHALLSSRYRNTSQKLMFPQFSDSFSFGFPNFHECKLGKDVFKFGLQKSSVHF